MTVDVSKMTPDLHVLIIIAKEIEFNDKQFAL